MNKKSTSAVTTENNHQVHGTIRDQHQQPMPKATVKAYSKTVRGRHLLGTSVTNAAGRYTIDYTPKKAAAVALIVCVYDSAKSLLKESEIHYKAPALLEVDIDLSGKSFVGISMFEQLLATTAPFTDDVALSELTETDKQTDISFITQNTGQPREHIERLAMAARFETYSSITAQVWFGILNENLPNKNSILLNPAPAIIDFERKLDTTFDELMHTSADVLLDGIQKAINDNIIAGTVTEELPKIRKQVSAQIQAYAKKHPVTGAPSLVHQKSELGGLKGKELDAFLELHNSHNGSNNNVWDAARTHPLLRDSKNIDQLQAVFRLSGLTGNNLSLTEYLVKSNKIKSNDGVKKLAAYDRGDWEALLKEHKIKLSDTIPGKDHTEKVQNYAAQLEATFTRVFPTAAFAARLEKDTNSKLPLKDKISTFLQNNGHFDLLKSNVGEFLKENKDAVPEKDAQDIADQLRRIQRVFKLSPTYDSVVHLLSNNIHSALQVHKMGKDNFVKTHGATLGKEAAAQVFEKADTVHANSLALVGNLKSMADASAMNAFPSIAPAIARVAQALPSLDSLFGHANSCDCQECSSVYGAPAYLADLLHFLNQRHSTLDPVGGITPSVKDILLRRRPDLADIDLKCDNTNTEVPYIDIACEIMEDYIAAPIVSLASSFLPKLVKGAIDASLLTAIKSQLITTGQTNINDLLTSGATVSASYTANRLQADNTFILSTHWIIRDAQVTLRATSNPGGTTIEFRVLHQTLLSSDAISASPEYVNTNAYNNFLKTAKTPFTLPFDLFETESDLYLDKLGIKKANLINSFSRTGQSAPGSPAQIQMGYAGLGINLSEQTLIFVPDTANQALYWGSVATNTTITIDVFEKLTGLNYAQVVNLVQLQFINPAKDSVIEHDDLTTDITKQRITNITAAKLDAIHRFLRLWRKTTLTMNELDSFIVIMSVQNGLGTPTLNSMLADELWQFILLQQSLQLTAFELLAFYGNLDLVHNLPDCQYNKVYQNNAITNPVNPNFSIKSINSQTIALGAPDNMVACAINQISLAELNALLAQTGTASIISFTTLSVIYRHARLAHALGISLTDLLTLLRLIPTNPFSTSGNTSLFVQRYKLLQSSGFNIQELDYVLRHQDNADHTLVPTTDQRSTALNQLQDDLVDIKTATTPATDPNGILLTKWLSDAVLKWDSSILNRLIDILSTVDDAAYQQKIAGNTNFLFNLRMQYQNSVITADLSALPLTIAVPPAVPVPIVIPASIAAQLTFDADKRQLILKGCISDADRTALLALSADATYQAAINSLSTVSGATNNGSGNTFFSSLTDVSTQLNNLLSANIADRFAIFINKLSPVYRKQLQSDALVKNISTWFSIDTTSVSILLLRVPEVFTDLTTDNFINKVPDLTTAGNPYPVQASRYQLVAKTFFILRKLNLPAAVLQDAVKFTQAAGPLMGCLDFRALPVAAINGSVTTFPGFEALVNLLRFYQLHPNRVIPFNTGGVGVYNVFGSLPHGNAADFPATIPAFIDLLVSEFAFSIGWNSTDLRTLLTQNFTVAADYLATSTILLRIHDCFTVMQQLGIALADAQRWCLFSLTSTDTAKIKQTLKSKYSSSDWLDVSKPLQDTLREKKRDALITYLLANPGSQTWKCPDDLYSYFLLDVQMCSCQPTSRIVQATNSVQLFVQRCFMGLEDSVLVNAKPDPNVSTSVADSNWLQWQWMKNFRVWQANIKVFLYPENWIEPELIPDGYKSPFLKDLENDLLQNEVTAANAEDAFQNYLLQLNEVARLEVKGMWYDDPSRTLHVFARTFGGNPQIYYYRQLINNKRWTPWTKIDLDITSDHIIPAVYNNRIYLFWALISEEADSTIPSITVPTPGTPFTPTQPNKNWLIQLAFSEYKNGKWTAKTVSKNDNLGQLRVPQSGKQDKGSFVFTALDIPNFDYSKIFVPGTTTHIDTQAVFNQKAAAAISQNGKLVISCYYYSFVSNGSFSNCTYVDSFQLDPVKGYPIELKVNYQVQLFQAPSYPERSSRKSAMVNMLDTESFTAAGAPPAPTNGIPGSGSGGLLVGEQAGGPFGNVIPLQMELIDRYNYMNSIYNNGSTSFQIQTPLGQHLPYFYQDQRRSYFIRSEFTDNGTYEFLYSDFVDSLLTLLQRPADYTTLFNQIDDALHLAHGTLPPFVSRYFNFHHPVVDYFIRRLFSNGIDGLMDRMTQLKGDFGYDSDPNKFSFQAYFQPVISGFNTVYNGSNLPAVTHNAITDPTPGYPKDDVDFDLQSGYALYNWELFFHAPLMIAERLSQNQQFDDADRWYRYIFNPMDTSTYPIPNKYWNTRPFFLATSTDYTNQQIDNILKGVNTGGSANQGLINNVTDWRANPFQPHFIAQYRTVAYQKTAVMKYVGHLIRHGDYLFRQQTMESVNEATQLYILASEILGPKPQVISSVATTSVDNYFQLEQKLDAMSDALVDVENLMPQQTVKNYTGIVPTGILPTLQTMYFCVPMNENLTGTTGYWDTVADRLFKIRHCLNIDGTFAPLSLFAPAVDPGMLVRATAAGLDIGSILNDTNAALPLYRFMVMMQKATELCNEVKSLGNALLSVLEKKDAETLSLLRSGHEINILNAVLLIKQKQIQDAQLALDNLTKQKDLITIRQQYYDGLINNGLNEQEVTSLGLMGDSKEHEKKITSYHYAAAIAALLPDFNLGIAGVGGSPHSHLTWGSSHINASASAYISAKSSEITIQDKTASITSTQGGYHRRSDDWQFQLDMAAKELEQIDKQLLGAQIRLDIANQDLANQQLQIDQAKEADDFMHSKFTNEDLFSWMITQVSTTYFKSYQLAYDIAKQTERCFRYELGLGDSAYINFGYWDNLKKGLQAGEQLFYDIKKMEMAYYEQNKRELELTKPISLSQLDAVALLKLKTTGECWINLPEELFDMDYPGHYMRRIKSVSITIPCISGPYSTVSCKLTMTKNSLRTSGVSAGDPAQYPRKTTSGLPVDDPRFRDAVGALQSIATSSAQNDSGLFELNFRDERYLPFEGAGAISLWHLELPAAVRQFDYDSISDVIIHLKYTARDGGDALKANAAANINARINQMLVSTRDTGLMRIFSAKNDLSSDWYRFLHPANTTDDQVLSLNLDTTRFPLFAQGKTIKITSVELVADSATAINNLQVIPPASSATPVSLVASGYGSWMGGTASYTSAKKDIGTWLIKNPVANIRLTDVVVTDNSATTVDNMVIIVHYEVS